MSNKRRTFTTEFKYEAAGLVIDHGYSCQAEAEVMRNIYEIPLHDEDQRDPRSL